MSNQHYSKLTASAVLVILLHVICWYQEVDGQSLMSRIYMPRKQVNDRFLRPIRSLRNWEYEVPIDKHDRQRLKPLDEHNLEERLHKVRRASKGSNCRPDGLNKGEGNGKPGSECFGANEISREEDKPLPIDDVKRMILRYEDMLDKLIIKGYPI